MVSFDGGLQAKSMTSQRNRAEPSQDGGYALLWQRYDILHLQQYSHRLNLLYVFFSFDERCEDIVKIERTELFGNTLHSA